MSKQSQNKTNQGYEAKPIFPMCSNCINFRSDKITTEYGYVAEVSIRCGVGDFAVKKQGTCNIHKFQNHQL